MPLIETKAKHDYETQELRHCDSIEVRRFVTPLMRHLMGCDDINRKDQSQGGYPGSVLLMSQGSLLSEKSRRTIGSVHLVMLPFRPCLHSTGFSFLGR